MLSLIAIGLRLRSMLPAIGAWALRHAALVGCLAMALLAGWERHQVATKGHALQRSTEALHRASQALTDASNASKAEQARAQAEHDATERQQKEQNDATDHRVSLARADDARRLADYERRLRATPAANHSAALPAPGQAGVASGGDGSGSDALVSPVTLDADLAICTVNSRRLMELHTEAVGGE